MTTELEIRTTSEINNNIESRELRKGFYDEKFDAVKLNCKLNKIADKQWISKESYDIEKKELLNELDQMYNNLVMGKKLVVQKALTQILLRFEKELEKTK